MEEKESEYCGKCVFCTSKCPKCGSTEIYAKYELRYFFLNDSADHIDIDRAGHLMVSCQACGESGLVREEDDETEENKGYHLLRRAIEDTLEIPEPLHFKIDEKGSIEGRTHAIVSKPLEDDAEGRRAGLKQWTKELVEHERKKQQEFREDFKEHMRSHGVKDFKFGDE